MCECTCVYVCCLTHPCTMNMQTNVAEEESKSCFCRPFFFPTWLPLTLVVLSFAMDEKVRANPREMKQGYMIRNTPPQMRLSPSPWPDVYVASASTRDNSSGLS